MMYCFYQQTVNVFDTLVLKCRERTHGPGPLKLIHGPATRYKVPRIQLEQRWAEEILADSKFQVRIISDLLELDVMLKD